MVTLTINYRQGVSKWTECLNRLRIGILTDEDRKFLQAILSVIPAKAPSEDGQLALLAKLGMCYYSDVLPAPRCTTLYTDVLPAPPATKT